jgi:ribosomal protein S1
MGWSRVADPSHVVQPGDDITVKVLRIESKEGDEKIALGLKQLADDPWSAVPAKYPVGQIVNGSVSRVADFGVFVEIEPGVVGLLPRAETGLASDADVRRAFTVGAAVTVIVIDVDVPARRMRLSVAAVQNAEEAAEVRDYAARTDAAAPSSSLGSLADKLRGALGSKHK